MVKNESCVASDSAICKWMGKDCKECYIEQIKTESDVSKIMENFGVTLSLLPDKFDELQGQDCCFCKQQKNPRAGYAVVDLAHSEPEYKKGMFFGLGKKVKQKVGSMMTVSVSVCKECRRVLRIAESLKWLWTILFIAIGVGVMLIPGVSGSISESQAFLPYVIVIGVGIIGYFLGKVSSRLYIKSKEQKMYTDVFDIPVCREMLDNGWFLLQNEQALRFTRKSMTRKVATLRETD